jgi:hypothetical protein
MFSVNLGGKLWEGIAFWIRFSAGVVTGLFILMGVFVWISLLRFSVTEVTCSDWGASVFSTLTSFGLLAMSN